jgi:hypothetical protein
MFATNPSLMVVYCHVVIFAETMEHDRDLEQEEMLGDIIHDGGDDITSQFLNDSDGEGREDDGSGDRMEGEDDGSGGVGALTVAKSGEVY